MGDPASKRRYEPPGGDSDDEADARGAPGPSRPLRALRGRGSPPATSRRLDESTQGARGGPVTHPRYAALVALDPFPLDELELLTASIDWLRHERRQDDDEIRRAQDVLARLIAQGWSLTLHHSRSEGSMAATGRPDRDRSAAEAIDAVSSALRLGFGVAERHPITADFEAK